VRARSSWSSRWSGALQGTVLAAALIALDLLPLYAWLLVAAAYATGDVARVALPFGFLAIASVAFALLGWALRRLPLAVTLPFALALGLALFAVAVAISPAAYGDVPGGLLGGGWLVALANDLADGTAHGSAFVALGALMLVLGWRGVALGREPPDLDSVLTLFKFSAAAIVAAAIAAATAAAHPRTQLNATLAFVLPLVVFAGLLASALSRAALNREELHNADARTAGGDRWLGMATVLSGVVVLVSLLISTVVTFGSLRAALAYLGPVGSALDTALDLLIAGFARLLFFIFGPLVDALQHIESTAKPLPTATPPAAAGTPQPGPTRSIVPDAWIHITQVVLVVLVVALIARVIVVVLRLATGARRPRIGDGVDEEREALDGASLLRAQLRGLLDRFGARQPAEAEEALPTGSVRALYRDVLRAAASRGLARRGPETPDEYARRLSGTLGGTVGGTVGGDAPASGAAASDLASVSEAYDEARYAEREAGEGERRTLRDQARRIIGAMRQVGQ
jgi:hypothetical protein